MKQKIFVSVILLLFSIVGCSPAAPDWSVAYAVVGTEYTQLWNLKAVDFLALINEGTEEGMQLSALHEFTPDDSNVMLSKNGETWKILLTVFSESDLEKSWFKQYQDAADWVGNIQKIELSLYAEDEQAAKENGLYVRQIITTITPGAERLVENTIGLYGEPEKGAAISDGVYRVSLDSVAYTYMPNQNRFIAQPHVEFWPDEEPTASVIQPD